MRDPFRSVICDSVEGLYGASKRMANDISMDEGHTEDTPEELQLSVNCASDMRHLG
jgi:hypothetical protein